MKLTPKAFFLSLAKAILISYIFVCLALSAMANSKNETLNTFAYTHHKGTITVAILTDSAYDKGIEILSPFDNYSDSGCFIGRNIIPIRFINFVMFRTTFPKNVCLLWQKKPLSIIKMYLTEKDI